MSSLLEGLRHCTSRAICSNYNRQPHCSRRALSRARRYVTVIHVSKSYVAFTNGNGKFLFISSVRFTEEGDIEQNKETMTAKLFTGLSSLNISVLR